MVLPLIAAAAGRLAMGAAGAAGGGLIGKAIGAMGGPLGATAITADVLPLLADFFSSDKPDPAKLDKVRQVRDGLAARMAAAEGIPIEKAKVAVDEQMKPLIEQAQQPEGGVGVGKTLVDASALGLTAALALRGKRGGAMKAGRSGAEPAAADENFNYHQADTGELPQRMPPSVPFSSGQDPRAAAAMQMLGPAEEAAEATGVADEMPPELAGGGGLDMANRGMMPQGRGTGSAMPRRKRKAG